MVRIDGLMLADEHRHGHLSVLPLKVVAVAEQLSEASVSSRQRLMFEEWEKTPDSGEPAAVAGSTTPSRLKEGRTEVEHP